MIYLVLFVYSIIMAYYVIYLKKAQDNFVWNTFTAIYFSLFFSIFQIIFFLMLPPYNAYHFTFKISVYPFFFAIFLLASQILNLLAFKNGPVTLTIVLGRYSIIITIVAGLFLWKETVSIFQLLGIILFIITIILFNRDSYKEKNKKKNITLKWFIQALLATVFVGVAVIFTKQYMVEFNSGIREYLILYNVFIIIISAAYILFKIINKGIDLKINRKLLLYTFLAALLLDIGNYIFMFYVAKYNSAFFLSAVSIFSTLGVLVLSAVILKEKLQLRSYIGIIASFIAIVFLSMS